MQRWNCKEKGPYMSAFAKRISALSPEKLALLKRHLQKQGANGARLQLFRRPRDGNTFPLSLARSGCGSSTSSNPGTPMYHIHAAYRFPGPLNVTVLEQSLNEIVRRHESLRTTFAVVDGQPVQVIALSQPLVLPRVDLCEMPEDGAEHGAAGG